MFLCVVVLVKIPVQIIGDRLEVTDNWQVYNKSSPFAQFALYSDKSSMVFDEAMTDTESKAGSFTLWFCGEKRVKQPVQDFGINADTVIGKGQPDGLRCTFFVQPSFRSLRLQEQPFLL